MNDETLRMACFSALDVLSAEFGDELPYAGGLDRGFAHGGVRVPFLSTQKGIFRARAQTGPAALSIQTSWRSPYDDEQVETGFMYAYRTGEVDQPDNRALRQAFVLQTPLVYFLATRPGWYKPVYPAFVVGDDPSARQVVVSPGRMVGPLDEREPFLVEDPIERRYAVRETRTRLHQARFRGRVLYAYAHTCTICRLKEDRLLEAAHIAGDLEAAGQPIVPNGLSLCSIHHKAYDRDLIGVAPDYTVRVSKRLLEDDDGPMLELLKQFHTHAIVVPSRAAWRPDPERLAERYERFTLAS